MATHHPTQITRDIIPGHHPSTRVHNWRYPLYYILLGYWTPLGVHWKLPDLVRELNNFPNEWMITFMSHPKPTLFSMGLKGSGRLALHSLLGTYKPGRVGWGLVAKRECYFPKMATRPPPQITTDIIPGHHHSTRVHKRRYPLY